MMTVEQKKMRLRCFRDQVLQFVQEFRLLVLRVSFRLKSFPLGRMSLSTEPRIATKLEDD